MDCSRTMLEFLQPHAFLFTFIEGDTNIGDYSLNCVQCTFKIPTKIASSSVDSTYYTILLVEHFKKKCLL